MFPFEATVNSCGKVVWILITQEGNCRFVLVLISLGCWLCIPSLLASPGLSEMAEENKLTMTYPVLHQKRSHQNVAKKNDSEHHLILPNTLLTVTLTYQVAKFQTRIAQCWLWCIMTSEVQKAKWIQQIIYLGSFLVSDQLKYMHELFEFIGYNNLSTCHFDLFF